MDGKKISFGFSKITKKPALQLNKSSKKDEDSKIELIKCLEGQQIKLVEEQKEAPPLVIPLKDGGKTSAALASLAKRRAVLLGEDDEPLAKKHASNSEQPSESNGAQSVEERNLDKRAESEILAELQAKNEEKNQENLVLPVVKADELPLDGAKESSLDDYESVPIVQYGWAMLRGMGAVEPPKSEQKLPVDNGPMQRPPGLGLGADKALKPKPLLELPEANEKLEIKKQAFVRILAGKFKDAYGQIEGFDHERGTIIVKMAIGSSKQKFQEFLCQPVSKKEYAQYGKCINKAKYEEYKKLENEHGQVIRKEEDKPKVKAEHIKHESPPIKIKTEMADLKKNSSDFDKRLKIDEIHGASTSSSRTNRYRSRSRSRSSSRSTRKYSSNKRYDNDSFSDDHKKKLSESQDTDSDSTYERRKSKSYSSKSRNHKKKHKRRRYSSGSSNGSDSSSKYRQSSSDSDDDTDKERRHRHKREKKKKSKKKTKKSKRERSRTPTRRRR